MACYIPRWYTRPKTVNHPGTNRTRRALTSFIRRTPLTTTPRRQPVTCSGVARSKYVGWTDMASVEREPITGVWRLIPPAGRPPPPACKNSSDLYQFQERPLAKVGPPRGDATVYCFHLMQPKRKTHVIVHGRRSGSYTQLD